MMKSTSGAVHLVLNVAVCKKGCYTPQEESLHD